MLVFIVGIKKTGNGDKFMLTKPTFDEIAVYFFTKKKQVSVQNALKLIKQYREKDNSELTISSTLKDLVELAEQENLQCSIEELKKAFQIDWDLRWLKNP